MASFFIPLTGLDADSKALNTIANNLSNMNTTGFKAQSTSFGDLLYQEIGASGSGDPILVGSGVKVAANTTDFSSGSISSTQSAADAAIDGSGFFILNNGGGGQVFTRNGGFQLASDGTLQSVGGQAVMGYGTVNGAVNSGGALSNIVIPTGQSMSPSATTTFGLVQNLNSNDAVGAKTSGTLQVFDSLGNSYEAQVSFTKTGTNAWSYSVSVPDTLQANSATAAGVTTINYNFGASGGTLATVNAGTNLAITGPTASGTATIAAPPIAPGESVSTYAADLTTALGTAGIVGATVTASAGGQLTITGTNISTSGNVVQDPVASAGATGALTFDVNGNLVSPATNVSGISFAGLSDGAANLNLAWDLYGANGSGNISQTVAADSGPSSTSQNGYATGQYKNFNIGSDGTISVSYSNGQTQNVGQLAVATFSNEQGLAATGSTNYQATSASGAAAVGTAGTGGRGSIEGSSLEASNVNISAEFSQLIIAQRAFEANAKSVTTFDTVTQDTINMVH